MKSMTTYANERAREDAKKGRWVLYSAAGVALLLALGLAGCPEYNIYSSRMEGEAELAKATYSKKVAVQTAQAKFDSADLEARTDMRRAEGIASANKTLSDGLGGPEGYLKWLYIEALKDVAQHNGTQTIYIATEAGVPVLEAGKRPITK
jgi:hypothetical protein